MDSTNRVDQQSMSRGLGGVEWSTTVIRRAEGGADGREGYRTTAKVTQGRGVVRSSKVST